MKSLWFVVLASLLLAGCGGGNKSSNSDPFKPSHSVQGSWEVTLPNVSVNQNTGYVEATLVQSGNTVSSTNVEYFEIHPDGYSWGACNASNTQSVSATVSGNTISGSISTCYGIATFTGTVSGSTIYGAWTGSQVGDAFSGSGPFSAAKVQPVLGTYAGNLPVYGTPDHVTVTVSQDSSGAILVTGSGVNTGSINLTGTAVGRAILAYGTAAGNYVQLCTFSYKNQLIVSAYEGGFDWLGELYKQ